MEGLDYFDSIAPIVKPEIFRDLLQLSAKECKVGHNGNVKTAFLHSPKEKEVYLERPEEFVKRGSNGVDSVFWLRKSIYGFKEAANTGVRR